MCELISALLASEGAQLRFAALLLVHDLMCKVRYLDLHKSMDLNPSSSSSRHTMDEP